MASFDKYNPEHQRLWDTMKIVRDANQLNIIATKVNQFKSVYQAVEKDTGVPWQMVAVIHIREAGLQDVGKFNGGIHNGQSWRRRATIIPRIGPFSSWRECAVVALRRQGLIGIGAWTPARMLSALEPYNGYGYRSKGIRSPYLWASTNHQQPGKYIRDGVFSRTVVDPQVGCAAMLKYLGVGQSSSAGPIVVATGAVTGAAVATVSYWDQVKQFAITHPWTTSLSLAALMALIIFSIEIYKNRKNTNVIKTTDPI